MFGGVHRTKNLSGLPSWVLADLKFWAQLNGEFTIYFNWTQFCSHSKLSMQMLYLVIQRRLVQAKPRTLGVLYFSPNKITSSFNFFLCTQTPNNAPEEVSEPKQEEPRSCLSYRIEKLPRGEPVGSAFQSWMGDGFPIHRGDIFHAINRLRKLKSNKRALEVSLFLLLRSFC